MLQIEILEQSERFLRQKDRPFKRYFKFSTLDHSTAHLILGPRGIGKTTLLVQYLNRAITKGHSALYIQADHVTLGSASLFEIAEQWYQSDGNLMCIDEIHKYPKWSKELKSIIDSFPNLKILTSGSSLLELQKGSHDLSRRIIKHHLEGFSFREFINFETGLDLDAISLEDIIHHHESHCKKILKKLNERRILPMFKKYLQMGYYPYSQEMDKDLFYLTLEQGIHTTIEADIPAVYQDFTAISTHKIFRLMQILAHNVPYQVDLKKLREAVDIADDRTLKSYLRLLQDSGLTQNLYSSGHKLGALRRPEKIYLNNSNLLFALNPQLHPEIIGTARETFFLRAVMNLYPTFFTKNGDFLVQNTYTFEVGGKSKNSRQIQNLEKAYLALDDIETGHRNSIPLWLFGFLY